MQNYNIVGLYKHNIESYQKIKKAFLSGENVVGIIHATGTGKTYNAIELMYENKDKKILFVAPSMAILEHIKKIINANQHLNLQKDFANVQFRTYQSFNNLNASEIANLKCDILILDEFHHLGAPIWGARINTLINTHPSLKILGLSAYSVRNRGTIYERNMASPEGSELFSNKIVSRYDLCDAMIDGVLPKPIYKSAYINLQAFTDQLEEKLAKKNIKNKDYQECSKILNDIKKRIHEAPNIVDVIKKNIKPNGKYIYFCPPLQKDNINNIETIKQEAKKWFLELVPEENIVFYTSTSKMYKNGRKNREAFYNDVDLKGNKVTNKLRVMFAINQYNEGIHAPNIDGVIMGRNTTSDIVYFEQLGRALAVRGNTKEMYQKYANYSQEELIKLCKQKDIAVSNIEDKEELIEKLIAPIIIDLTNNLAFIKELENNLKVRINEIKKQNNTSKRSLKITESSFDIEMLNQDIYSLLKYVMDRLTMNWQDKYELAKSYYNHHGNLKIPQDFKTINGYEYNENGVALGTWIINNRHAYKGVGSFELTADRIKLLNEIEMIWDLRNDEWQEKYELAKAYYEHYGNLKIPSNFKTKNGYEYDENGVALGTWIINNRKKKFGTKDANHQKLLDDIKMIWDYPNEGWQENYELAKAYYEHYGNLKIPRDFKTKNGYEYDENGASLGIWISTQRQICNGKKKGFNLTRKKLLEEIGMAWDLRSNEWQENYDLAKSYYEHHGDLLIPRSFKTKNGYEYAEDGVSLGTWLQAIRQSYKGTGSYRLTAQKIKLLENIGIQWFTGNIAEKYQKEKITKDNIIRKKKELLHRAYSLLNTYDTSKLYSKEIINKDMQDALDNNIKK